MPEVIIDQKKVFYVCGSDEEKTPVILIHGSGGGHHHWSCQIRDLSKTLFPIAPDLPGHGRSTGSPLGKIEAYSDWVKSFTEHLGLNKFIIGGHSMGGAVALDFALRRPESLAGLILIGTGARLRVLPAVLQKLEEGTIPSDFINYMYGPEAPEALIDLARSELKSADPAVFHSDLSACDKFDIIDQLDEIKTRTLIICGSKDLLTPMKYSRFLHENITGSSLVEVEGAGHMIMLEKASAVNEAIISSFEKI